MFHLVQWITLIQCPMVTIPPRMASSPPGQAIGSMSHKASIYESAAIAQVVGLCFLFAIPYNLTVLCVHFLSLSHRFRFGLSDLSLCSNPHYWLAIPNSIIYVKALVTLDNFGFYLTNSDFCKHFGPL